MALKLVIQTYQILTKNDEVCISSLSRFFIAVTRFFNCVWLFLGRTWIEAQAQKCLQIILRKSWIGDQRSGWFWSTFQEIGIHGCTFSWDSSIAANSYKFGQFDQLGKKLFWQTRYLFAGFHWNVKNKCTKTVCQSIEWFISWLLQSNIHDLYDRFYNFTLTVLH